MKKMYLPLMVTVLLAFSSIGIMRTEAQVTIGMNGAPISGALLDLKQQTASPSDNSTATKGFMYPRVALTNTKDLYPMFSSATSATVKKEHVGLTVYNVGTTNGFVPGLYVWDGENWVKPVTELPRVETTQVNVVDLVKESGQSQQKTVTVESGGPNAAYGELGSELKFGNPSNFGNIIIPDDGSYAFSFRFYGMISSSGTTVGNVNNPGNNFNTNAKTAIYYLSIWKNNTTDAANLKDIAEIDINVIKNNVAGVLDVYTYSITMGAFFKKGDKVVIKMSARWNTQDAFNVWKWDLVSDPIRTGTISAARTSMVWWRL